MIRLTARHFDFYSRCPRSFFLCFIAKVEPMISRREAIPMIIKSAVEDFLINRSWESSCSVMMELFPVVNSQLAEHERDMLGYDLELVARTVGGWIIASNLGSNVTKVPGDVVLSGKKYFVSTDLLIEERSGNSVVVTVSTLRDPIKRRYRYMFSYSAWINNLAYRLLYGGDRLNPVSHVYSIRRSLIKPRRVSKTSIDHHLKTNEYFNEPISDCRMLPRVENPRMLGARLSFDIISSPAAFYQHYDFPMFSINSESPIDGMVEMIDFAISRNLFPERLDSCNSCSYQRLCVTGIKQRDILNGKLPDGYRFQQEG